MAISCAWYKSSFQTFLVLFTPKENPKNSKIGLDRLLFGDCGFEKQSNWSNNLLIYCIWIIWALDQAFCACWLNEIQSKYQTSLYKQRCGFSMQFSFQLLFYGFGWYLFPLNCTIAFNMISLNLAIDSKFTIW